LATTELLAFVAGLIVLRDGEAETKEGEDEMKEPGPP
jgi:hypothetical protein